MSTDTVIFNDVGPALLRRMLIMRVSEAVDISAWTAKVPEGRIPVFDTFELGEKVVRHYLKLEWRPRELIRIMPEWVSGSKCQVRAVDVPAVVWWLDEGETISGAFRSAAECYWGALDRWPQRGWAWKDLPTLTLPSPEGRGEIQLAKEKWVPKGCVVLA